MSLSQGYRLRHLFGWRECRGNANYQRSISAENGKTSSDPCPHTENAVRKRSQGTISPWPSSCWSHCLLPKWKTFRLRLEKRDEKGSMDGGSGDVTRGEGEREELLRSVALQVVQRIEVRSERVEFYFSGLASLENGTFTHLLLYSFV